MKNYLLTDNQDSFSPIIVKAENIEEAIAKSIKGMLNEGVYTPEQLLSVLDLNLIEFENITTYE